MAIQRLVQIEASVFQKDPLEVFLSSFRSPQTRTAYRGDLKKFFEYIEKYNISIDQVKSLHITEYLNHIHSKYAPKTFNRRLSAVKSFFKWAVKNDLLPKNPADGIKYEKAEAINPTTALTDKEARNMMDSPNLMTITGASDHLAMILLFHLALRRAELVNLRWENIREERGIYILQYQSKGRKQMQVPLTKKVLDEIHSFKKLYERRTKTTLLPEHFILQRFRKISVKAPDPSTILKMMKKYAKMVGITKTVGVHTCRATVLSQLLEKNESIRNVQAFAGHSSPYVTMMYDKKRDGLKNSSAFKVDFDNDDEDPSDGEDK